MTQLETSKTATVNQMIDDISEMDGKYLTFWTDKQLFGIPIKDVVQIVGMQDIAAIPEFPAYAKGIINLRGSIIPLIDVRLLDIIDAKLAEYRTYRDQVIDLGLKMENDAAMELFYTMARPLLNEAMIAAQDLMTIIGQVGADVSEDLSSETNLILIIVYIAIAIAGALVISIILSVFVSGSISKPVKELEGAMHALTCADQLRHS